MQLPDQLKKAIEHYLNGTATENDIQIVNEWYYSFDDNAVEVAASVKDLRTQIEKRLLDRMQQELHHPPVHSPKFLWPWKRIAAVAAVIVLAGATFWWMNKSTGSQQPQAELKTTQASHHKVMLLPDGTKVTVNLNSKLQYPTVFKTDIREVYLSGEAYFEVAHDAARPFIVHTGSYSTKVLGTVFNVNAYPGSEQVTVTVTSGKVQVYEADKSLGILTAQEQLVINKKTGTAEQAKANAAQVSEWKDEDLVFDNITFEEAAALISARYGVQLQFANDAIRLCRFTSTFFSSNGLEQVMDIITTITHCTWKKAGNNSIMIDGKGCDE